MLQIRCKNNNVTKSFPEGTSLLDVYQEFADDIKLPYPVVSAKVNKGHIARTIIQHYVNNINCKFQRDDDLESKLKKVFGEIRNPIIIKEKDKTDSTRNNYYKIENTQLLVPTNCWGQGSPQFKKLLKKANDLGYEIVALD